MKKSFYVYELKCLTTGKVYFGVTQNFKQRMYAHFSPKTTSIIKKDLRANGVNGFSKKIIKKYDGKNSEIKALLTEAYLCERQMIKDSSKLYTKRWENKLLYDFMHQNGKNISTLNVRHINYL